MIPSWWNAPGIAWAWQVILHSAVAAAAFGLWSRRLRLACGAARRVMLGVVLALPLATAAVPGRGGDLFRDRLAWFDSARLVALPLPIPGLHLYHLALAAAAAAVLAFAFQELRPLAGRRRPVEPGAAPRGLVSLARSLPGWAEVTVGVEAGEAISLSTTGRPGRPCLAVSRGALDRLAADELAAVVRHEHAHWRAGRWWSAHALFALRLVQLWNPVALWSFREYLVETEIACDREAVAAGGGDAKPLARALLAVYEETPRREVAARSLLRRRVDVLLGRLPAAGDGPPPATVAAAALLLALTLPFLV